jgi:hypothetical protein
MGMKQWPMKIGPHMKGFFRSSKNYGFTDWVGNKAKPNGVLAQP